jgi:hypothetical protein
MFFEKFGKKEELKDHFDIHHERKTPRYASQAGITFAGFEGEAKVKNVSLLGCCLESVTYASILPDEVYTAKIILEARKKIEAFDLRLKLHWSRSNETLYEAGFTLEDNQSNTKLLQYVELLCSDGIQPEYGNMGDK